MNKAITLFLILAIAAIIVGCAQQVGKTTTEAPATLTEENQQAIDDADALDELEDAELESELDDIENILDQILA